jgi:hypothetical protein
MNTDGTLEELVNAEKIVKQWYLNDTIFLSLLLVDRFTCPRYGTI